MAKWAQGNFEDDGNALKVLIVIMVEHIKSLLKLLTCTITTGQLYICKLYLNILFFLKKCLPDQTGNV